MDTRISVIQYIKSGLISVNTEISNIRASLDVDIRVQQFLMNSIDYRTLYQEIIRKEDQLKNEQNLEYKTNISIELIDLLKLKKEFTIDALQLADVFSKLDIRTERLQKAKELFVKGDFKEADALLIESELSTEQFNLLIQVAYLEKRRHRFLSPSLNNKNE